MAGSIEDLLDDENLNIELDQKETLENLMTKSINRSKNFYLILVLIKRKMFIEKCSRHHNEINNIDISKLNQNKTKRNGLY